TMPVLLMCVQHAEMFLTFRSWIRINATLPYLISLLCAPIPLLLFLQLRSLAKRARSAHLAEHCAIVGTGASLSLIYMGAIVFVLDNAKLLGLSSSWSTTSSTSLLLVLALAVAAALFLLWSIYLLT